MPRPEVWVGPTRHFWSWKEAGTLRRGPLRVNPWLAPYANAKPFRRPTDLMWLLDLFKDGMAAAGLTGIESGTKLNYFRRLENSSDMLSIMTETGNQLLAPFPCSLIPTFL
ncbi:hypothetical protein AAC387_Pa09g2393 [Persea americana]